MLQNDEIKRKRKEELALWCFFTLLFGALPIFFLVVTSLFTGNMIKLNTLSKEMFFLTIILCADILRTLYTMNDKKMHDGKAILYGLSIFILVISSVLYGGILLHKEEDIDIFAYRISLFLCIFSMLLGFLTQILATARNSNVEK